MSKKAARKKADKNKQEYNEISESVSQESVASQSVSSDPVSDKTPLSEELPKNYEYIPFVVEIPNGSGNIPDDSKLEFSATNLDYPLFSLGFHHYIHSNKNKMEILNEFEGKKKVYLVMNKFERYIDNYDNDIGHFSDQFFKDEPKILSRAFYKLWEMLFMFDIVDLHKSHFISAHLAEGPGSFVQATMFFRDKYAKEDTKNDKYYAITLHPEDGQQHVELSEEFTKYYESEKPKRLIIHRTVPKQVAGGLKTRDNGDITDPKTIKLFGGQMGKDKADLVTADGGFDWTSENIQEQEAFRLIFAQILTAFKIQAKNGTFICKFFETFTDTSTKFIYLLSQMYDQIILTKPLTSRPSNSEKYIVCLNFKYTDKDPEYKATITKMDEILNKLHKRPSDNLIKIWPDLIVPEDFLRTMIYCNTTIANRQLKSLNEIVEFIKAQNYYGDVYQMRRQMQIDANTYWINTYMPPDDKFEDALSEIRQRTEIIIDKNSDKKLLPNINT